MCKTPVPAELTDLLSFWLELKTSAGAVSMHQALDNLADIRPAHSLLVGTNTAMLTLPSPGKNKEAPTPIETLQLQTIHVQLQLSMNVVH